MKKFGRLYRPHLEENSFFLRNAAKLKRLQYFSIFTLYCICNEYEITLGNKEADHQLNLELGRPNIKFMLHRTEYTWIIFAYD